MNYQAHGKHYIAGERVASAEKFLSKPAISEAASFSQGSVVLIDRAVTAAEECAEFFAATTRQQRADFLRTIADEIDLRGAEITAMAHAESALPEARLIGERGRTTMQLKLFADHIEIGDYLDIRRDTALPDRQPAPRPELKMMQIPVGPVAVFGASNFPLAFSVAGSDTASALAAGCPVVVKGHEAHPGTTELVADAIAAAVVKTSMPAGVFSMVHGGSIEVGQSLVKHPKITAVGFTGGLTAGRVLFDLCAQRTNPIPLFGVFHHYFPAEARGLELNQHRQGLGSPSRVHRLPYKIYTWQVFYYSLSI